MYIVLQYDEYLNVIALALSIHQIKKYISDKKKYIRSQRTSLAKNI